jgi:2-methylisocitrate lyase-like PEP mutase family enzyme
MADQRTRTAAFRAMHEARPGFVLPNPWDVASARIMRHYGFRALATSSAAHANTIGRPDTAITLDDALEHCRQIVAATDLPVNADFEHGFADRPQDVARNVELALETGLSGLSIEDRTRDGAEPIYPFEVAVDRVRLAVAAARRNGTGAVITARCENFFAGRKDMDDTIKRLKAYEAAGADVVYATGLTTIDEVRTIVAAVRTPVNVMAMKTFTVPELHAAGVRRVSLGPWFHRAALGGLIAAVREVAETGGLSFIVSAPTGAAINKMLD